MYPLILFFTSAAPAASLKAGTKILKCLDVRVDVLVCNLCKCFNFNIVHTVKYDGGLYLVKNPCF